MVTYPKDWKIITLGEQCEITSSKRVFESEWKKIGIPFLRTRDIACFHSGEEQNDKLFISPSTYAEKISSSGEPQKGDLLVTGVGTIGLPYLIRSDKKIYFKDGNILWLKKSNSFYPDYLYFQFLSKPIKTQISEMSGFTTVGTLTIENTKKLKLPLPSIKEQQAIADTIIGVNEHIDNLSTLIDKKKMIRAGALEDLVTGKTRLAGFNGEWKKVSFDEVITPKARIGWQGLKKDEYQKYGYSYLIGGINFENGKIKQDELFSVSQERYDLDPYIQVKENDVLVTKDGTIGKVARVPKLDKPATLNSGVFVFRTSERLCKDFLFTVLISSIFKGFIDTLSAGSTIKHLYQKDLKKFSFDMPENVEEQEAIAVTITKMDDEIEALETEKEKMMDIREGVMDDLLTGRVRIKI